MHTHTRCISMHAQGFILFLESALPLSSGTGNGDPWPIPQDNGNTDSGNNIGFLSTFENQQWSAWLLGVHASLLPRAVGCRPAFSKTCQSLQAERYM